MQRPSSFEPVSLLRLRAFLNRRAAVPRPHFRQNLTNRLKPVSVFPRSEALVEGAGSIGADTGGLTAASDPGVLPVKPTDFSPILPKSPDFAINPVTPDRTPPAARFFRSLLDRTEISREPNPNSMPVPSETRLDAKRSGPIRELELAKQLEHESPLQILPIALQQFLSARLGLVLPNVRVHVGPAANKLAALVNADAVSFADRIAMRHHRYEPRTAAGAALIGHELTHIAAAESRREPTSGTSNAREEEAAIRNEYLVYTDFNSSMPQRGPKSAIADLQSAQRQHTATRFGNPISSDLIQSAIHPPPSPAPMISPTITPVRTAAVDRPRPSDAVPTTVPNIVQLKEEIFRDLMDRLRTDFERGS